MSRISATIAFHRAALSRRAPPLSNELITQMRDRRRCQQDDAHPEL
jgi:hypothetical protein